MKAEKVVFVVDDDEDARSSVCALFKSMGMRCEAFDSGEAFLAAYQPDQPGCLVTDLRMCGMNGLELQEEIARRGWLLPVVLISAHVGVRDTVVAVKAGAEQVLEKPYRDQELWDAVQAALRRQERERAEAERCQQLRDRFARLTVEERQVLDLIAQGLPNKTVARRLDVGLRTVEDRRRRIMEKVGSSSFATLMTVFTELRTLEEQFPSQVSAR